MCKRIGDRKHKKYYECSRRDLINAAKDNKRDYWLNINDASIALSYVGETYRTFKKGSAKHKLVCKLDRYVDWALGDFARTAQRPNLIKLVIME